MWSPSPKNKNSPQPGVFRRTLKSSFSSSTSSKSAVSDFSDGEAPLVILKVQVIGCTNLPAADLNGKSDPYVVLTFGQQRVKTPPIKRTLNPKYLAKDATFELPIYASEVGRYGGFLTLSYGIRILSGKTISLNCR
ncbi:hypothetical protein BS47DRAFT_243143 [Hydnum rufescens UP504]|uniref:C2 domain-containing protein n=1 Tax=Hydnum rufescens UP504 TaxID=1448309 RepID=A0A9P6AMT1_9AGAM|nr:hypothetical protein BS47DRAFT_243028 [Hydnum rufescens UP504]KAF9508295.1 hypothetical protein BS47DRAFT_243143 [Hydnum rufescens UP504]